MMGLRAARNLQDWGRRIADFMGPGMGSCAKLGVSLLALRACAFAIPLMLAVPALQGCATHSSAALFDVGAGASAELQALSKRAAAGDKRAQYELGMRFEEGVGVVKNLDMAISLYRLAASDNIRTLYAYSPAVGDKVAAQVIPIKTAPDGAGLPEAANRLAALATNSASHGAEPNQMAVANKPIRGALPWGPSEVFRLILVHAAEMRPLGPDNLRRLMTARTDPLPGRGSQTAYLSRDYACATNDLHIPSQYLARVCDQSAMVTMHVYNETPHGQSNFLFGEFLKRVDLERLDVINLNKDNKFIEPRSGHFPYPMSAKLILSKEGSRIILVESFTSKSRDPIEDRVSTVTVFDRK